MDRQTAEPVARNVIASTCELDRIQASWLASVLTDAEAVRLANPDSRELPGLDAIRSIAADCAKRIELSLRPKKAAA